MFRSLFLLNSIGLVLGGTVLWDGRFNDMTSSAALGDWSFSNPIGSYQYYIHGASPVASYVNLDTTFKNPADTGSTQGVKITLDSTSYWNGQTMRRTELIPQTSAAINAGKVFYHFSMMRSAINPPSEFREHQIAFFESHFTEMKSGWMSGASGTNDPLLRWDVTGSTEWNTTWEAGVWHNVAYGIDFSAGTVAFYHSTGADDLVLTVPAVPCTASSDGKDWHLGVLELPRDGYADADEDIYFSGVYVESGELTTDVSGPGGASSSGSTPAVSSAAAVATPVASPVVASTPAVVVASSTAAASPVVVSSSAVASEAAVETSVPVAAEPTSALAATTAVPIPTSSAAAVESIVPSTTASSSTPSETAEPAGDDEEDDEDCY